MRRSAWVGLALVALLVATGAAFAAVRAVTPGEPVYSVAQVAAGLRRHPHAWAGRTVQVRGDVVNLITTSSIDDWSEAPCLSQGCTLPYPAMYPGGRLHVILIDDGSPFSPATAYELQRQAAFNLPLSAGPSAVPHLMLRAQPPARGGLLATLRRLPLLGRLFLDLPTVQGHVERVYRVRILPRTQARCTLGVWCDDGALLGSL